MYVGITYSRIANFGDPEYARNLVEKIILKYLLILRLYLSSALHVSAFVCEVFITGAPKIDRSSKATIFSGYIMAIVQLCGMIEYKYNDHMYHSAQ